MSFSCRGSLLIFILGVGVSLVGSGCTLFDDDNWYEDYGGGGDYNDDYDYDDGYGGGSGVGESRISLVLGQRDIGDFDDLGGLDVSDHTTFGVMFNHIAKRDGDHGLGFEGAFLYSMADDSVGAVDYELQMMDILIGGRYTYMGFGEFRPYAAAGVDVILASDELDGGVISGSGADDDFGIYAAVGANYETKGGLSIGIDVRTVTGTDNDLDYLMYAAQVGWEF